MQIQDTLANVTALVPQIQKIIWNTTNPKTQVLWEEMLKECHDFIEAEVERLKSIETVEGENIAMLLENDYAFGLSMLTSNIEMIEAFFTHVAKENVTKGVLRRDKLGVLIGKECGRGEFYGNDNGFFATRLIRNQDLPKVFKVIAKFYGINSAFKVSSKKSYNGANVTLTQKEGKFTPYNNLQGLVNGVRQTRRYGMGGDSYNTSCDFSVCIN